ncbi:MAG: RnfH family protein [Xanthomonadaceae bacterium]|nr:RnfH family protein [Xanthomonadaceae bacterium]
MDEHPYIEVSVVYAEPRRALRIDLKLPLGATLADAIERSGLRTAHPEIGIRADRLGIFSRKAAPDTVLRDGDRVEIYRPLLIDPKEARRQRARAGPGKQA